MEEMKMKKPKHDIKADEISIKKMQFKIINRYPKYSKNEYMNVKTKIEHELYEVFKKYA